MYKQGDKVVYGIHGVCEILEVVTRIIDRRKRDFYVLQPIGQTADRFFVPTDNAAALFFFFNTIVVTINDSNDWNHHKELINDLDDYEFKTIFDKGVYDISIDYIHYLHIKESIIIPIKDDEEKIAEMIMEIREAKNDNTYGAEVVDMLQKGLLQTAEIDAIRVKIENTYFDLGLGA